MHANRQGDRDNGRQFFGDCADSQGHSGIKHLSDWPATGQAHRHRDGNQYQDPLQDRQAEALKFAGERCALGGRFLHRCCNEPHGCGIPGRHYKATALPGCDKTACPGHGQLLRQGGLEIIRLAALLDGPGFTGKGGFIHLQIAGADQTQISGHLVACRQ